MIILKMNIIYPNVQIDVSCILSHVFSYNSKYSRETASSTRRNVFKGTSTMAFDDLAGLNTISKGIYEETRSNYDREEKQIKDINSEVVKLIENLEKRSNDETKT